MGITVYYRVGSKHEPRGRTGFAHLFEHIRFTGSENVENFDIPLQGAGSTPTSGSTWYDRTNFVETVPTSALDLANEVMGNGFLSRLMGDLRETRGWTYSIRSGLPGRIGPQAFTVSTAVQADRTADSIRAIVEQMEAFPATRPVNQVELQRVADGNVRGLPNRFETNDQVLDALLANRLFGRPDDYQERLPEIYRSIQAADIDTAAAQYLHPRDMAIVVVGDRAVIDDQIATLGMEVEYMAAEGL